MIACYARVSTYDQSLRSQEGDLHRWADSQGEPVTWYTDHSTGTNTDRPGLGRLLDDVRRGHVHKIAIWRLDRLGRSVMDGLALLREMQERGVGLVSLREGFDLDTPAGRMIATVLLSFAQYETEVRKERQMAGIEATKQAGVTKRGTVPYQGRAKGDRYKLTEAVLKDVQLLRLEGRSPAHIGRLLHLSRASVYRALEIVYDKHGGQA
jgi:DNA invertase Pin-like site-specific DNA recombinase